VYAHERLWRCCAQEESGENWHCLWLRLRIGAGAAGHLFLGGAYVHPATSKGRH
jgi:hypothetical protein